MVAVAQLVGVRQIAADIEPPSSPAAKAAASRPTRGWAEREHQPNAVQNLVGLESGNQSCSEVVSATSSDEEGA